jgi:hypothetical protein
VPKIFAGVDEEVWVLGAALGNQRGDEVGHDRGHGAHCDPTIKRGVIAELFGGVFDFEEDAAGSFEERGSGLSEHGFAAEAVEKLVTDLAFKI